jgi:hypothetical protein
MILFVVSKSATEKRLNFFKKKILPYRRPETQAIPLNAALNGWKLSEEHSIFVPALPAHHAVDRDSLFQNARLNCLHTASLPSSRDDALHR